MREYWKCQTDRNKEKDKNIYIRKNSKERDLERFTEKNHEEQYYIKLVEGIRQETFRIAKMQDESGDRVKERK